MSKHARKRMDLTGIVRLSFLKFFSVLTFGVFGGLGSYWRVSGQISRKEFWQNYVVVPILIAFLALAFFRILNIHGFLSPLNYGLRRIILCVMLSPAIFAHVIGQIKRLRDMGLSPWFALANFIPLYGTAALVILVGFIGGFRRHRRGVPKDF